MCEIRGVCMWKLRIFANSLSRFCLIVVDVDFNVLTFFALLFLLYGSILLAHIVCIYRLLSPHLKTHQLCELFVFVSISFSVSLSVESFSLLLHWSTLALYIQVCVFVHANKLFLSFASCSSSSKQYRWIGRMLCCDSCWHRRDETQQVTVWYAQNENGTG